MDEHCDAIQAYFNQDDCSNSAILNILQNDSNNLILKPIESLDENVSFQVLKDIYDSQIVTLDDNLRKQFEISNSSVGKNHLKQHAISLEYYGNIPLHIRNIRLKYFSDIMVISKCPHNGNFPK